MSDVGTIDASSLVVKNGAITADGNSGAKSGFLNISSLDVRVAVTNMQGTSVAFIVEESTTGSGSWTTLGASHTITGTGTYEWTNLVPTKDYVRIAWDITGTKARIFAVLDPTVRAGTKAAAVVAALVDNSGGAAADGTIAAVTDAATAANAIKELATKLNAILTSLKDAGVMASS